jgi:hypothetical protein
MTAIFIGAFYKRSSATAAIPNASNSSAALPIGRSFVLAAPRISESEC